MEETIITPPEPGEYLTARNRHVSVRDEENSIRIDALHITKFSTNKQALLLNDITLAIPARSFVAIVGASGAGKTTLMNVLSGLSAPDDGQALYNGQDFYRSPASFRTSIGYVPQEDILHRDLTVERVLYYTARLRLPPHFTKNQVEQRIDAVLANVEMTDRRTTLVRKLSGGQRKRVSIALELLANPGIFFLDEPTSGLDAALDRKMMFLLRRLADEGRTIVLATHTTSNISLCDYICFLTQDGRLAYFGPPECAKGYFDKTDFAEIYTAIEPTPKLPNKTWQAEVRFRISQDYQTFVINQLGRQSDEKGCNKPLQARQTKAHRQHRQHRRCSPWQQFFLLTQRYLELLKNGRGNLLILLLQAPVISLMLLLLARYELGTDLFNTRNIVQCPTQAHILTSTGLPNTPGPFSTVTARDCQRVARFLRDNPTGQAYASKRGGVQQALQDFIVPGTSSNAEMLLFIMAYSTMMLSCMNAAREIVKEAPIYRHERNVNLGLLPYVFSKIITLGSICLLQAATLVVTINSVEPFHQGIFLPALLEIYITVALTSLTGVLLGLAISALTDATDQAMSCIPLLLIPQITFSGAVFPLKDTFIQIFGMLFAARWSLAALGSSEGLHSNKLSGDMLFGNDAIFHGTLFSLYSQTDAFQHLFLTWSALSLMLLLLLLAICYLLKRKDVYA